MGFVVNVENISVEIFGGIGGELTSNKITVYQSTVPNAYPSFPYTYKQDFSQANFFGGIKIGFGFKQNRQLSRRYYDYVLRNFTRNDNKKIMQDYRDRVISRQELREYYQVRKQQYRIIKREYIQFYADTAYLNQVVSEAEKTLREYFRQDYKKKL